MWAWFADMKNERNCLLCDALPQLHGLVWAWFADMKNERNCLLRDALPQLHGLVWAWFADCTAWCGRGLQT